MRWTCGLLVALVLLSAFVAPAAAQLVAGPGRIPPEIERATSPLTAEQIQSIDAYVKHWLGVLAGGSPEDAVSGRDQLMTPFDRGGTPIFLNAYSASLSRHLIPVVATENAAAGLNAMIVAARLMDVGAIEVIKAGLANQANIPVRYWAVKTLEALPANLIKRDANLTLTAADQRGLLDALVAATERETSEHVMRQLLPSMMSLTIPEANLALLKVLEARAAAHAKNPNLTVGPELQAMLRMWRTVVRETVDAKAQGKKINVDLLNTIARLSYVYLALSTNVLRNHHQTLSAADEAEHRAMLEIADGFLRFCVEQISPGTKMPRKPAELPDIDRFHAEIAQWPVILTAPPFSFDAKSLAVSANH